MSDCKHEGTNSTAADSYVAFEFRFTTDRAQRIIVVR